MPRSAASPAAPPRDTAIRPADERVVPVLRHFGCPLAAARRRSARALARTRCDRGADPWAVDWMAWRLLEYSRRCAAGGEDVSMQVGRRWIPVAVAVTAALNTGCEKPAAVALSPPEVYVATVDQQDVPVYL